MILTIEDYIHQVRENFILKRKSSTAIVYEMDTVPEFLMGEFLGRISSPSIYRIGCNNGCLLMKPNTILCTRKIEEYEHANKLLNLDSDFFVYSYGFGSGDVGSKAKMVPIQFNALYDKEQLYDRNSRTIPNGRISIYAGIFLALFCRFSRIIAFGAEGMNNVPVKENAIFRKQIAYISQIAPYVSINTNITYVDAKTDLKSVI
jgi:hypothetical protein